MTTASGAVVANIPINKNTIPSKAIKLALTSFEFFHGFDDISTIWVFG